MEDYLREFAKAIDTDAISRLRQGAQSQADSERYARYALATKQAPDLSTSHLVLDQPVVEIGQSDDISPEDRAELTTALRAFMPWKKGPFRIFGIDIDAEWRSDIKWSRIEGKVGNLRGKVVADIGCHNGYFMYRMAATEPALVIGFEPYIKLYYNFHLLQKYAKVKNLVFEPFGVEHLGFYPNFFDRIFCMGILYHHRDPVGLLQLMRKSLRPGGDIVIDCQGIDSLEQIALVPENRYANATGIWFLPSLPALLNWVKRAGFQKVEVLFSGPLTSVEQRTTNWANIPSLTDFLDPKDPTKTMEGYPGPWRYYLIAK